MPRHSERPLHVLVGGGSIAGLCAGLALRGVGANVDVFERSSGALEARGAGIVVQEELLSFLRRHGAPALPATSCRTRRYLQPDGGEGRAQSMPQSFTSWEAIYQTLRATFPDTLYHSSAAIEGFKNGDCGIVVDIAGRGRMDADLLVCADGAQSATRSRLLPEVLPQYAGYIAWRGTVDESAAPPELGAFFDDTFTFCEAAGGGHMLVYFIPGPNADTSKGHRRLNWVWYVQASGRDLRQLLTDRDGRLHDHSLQAGSVRAENVSELQARVRREMHPRMAGLIAITAEPFIQTIVDVVVPRTVFGRAALVGDAAFVVRPHTAGATAKAAVDASLLATSLDQAGGSIEPALRKFEFAQIRYGREMHGHGVALGDVGRLFRRNGTPD